jgi:DNA-binding transcriptional regulator YiaG
MTNPTPADIKLLRLCAKMTQKQFATELCVSVNAVERWEGGSRPMNQTAWKLANILFK